MLQIPVPEPRRSPGKQTISSHYSYTLNLIAFLIYHIEPDCFALVLNNHLFGFGAQAPAVLGSGHRGGHKELLYYGEGGKVCGRLSCDRSSVSLLWRHRERRRARALDPKHRMSLVTPSLLALFSGGGGALAFMRGPQVHFSLLRTFPSESGPIKDNGSITDADELVPSTSGARGSFSLGPKSRRSSSLACDSGTDTEELFTLLVSNC